MPNLKNETRFWDRIARKYAANPISDMAGYERTLAATRGYFNNTTRAYELGCGTGTTALTLASSLAELVATDISAEMISIAREKAKAQGIANVSFEVGTTDDSAHADEAFDSVLAFNVLHLLADRTKALRGVHRLLKPGGLFISKTPCLNEMTFLLRFVIPVLQFIGKAPHVSFFSAETLVKDIEAAVL